MSLHEYLMSQEIDSKQYPFYALIMAAMRQADTRNLASLQDGFPQVWTEFQARYNAPGGIIE
jgi:hypothetical protein